MPNCGVIKLVVLLHDCRGPCVFAVDLYLLTLVADLQWILVSVFCRIEGGMCRKLGMFTWCHFEPCCQQYSFFLVALVCWLGLLPCRCLVAHIREWLIVL